MLEQINSIYATFVSQGSTFEEANNRDGTSTVSTGNRSVEISPDFRINTWESAIGQHIMDGSQTIYRVIQPVYRFQIPIHRIKKINSLTLRFNSQVFYSEHFKKETETLPFNVTIRVVNQQKRYNPEQVLQAPAIKQLSLTATQYNILLTEELKLYLTDYDIYLAFSSDEQEKNTSIWDNQNLTLPTDEKFKAIKLSSVTLILDAEEYEYTTDGVGFSHYKTTPSSLIEVPGNSQSSLYPIPGGAVQVIPQKETIGALIRYPSAAVAVRQYEIICKERGLAFPAVLSEKIENVTIQRNSNHPPGDVIIYRWNVFPNVYNRNFTRLGQFNLEDPQIVALIIEPGKLWFHFEQFDKREKRFRPVRLVEERGNLVIRAFA